MRPPAEIAGQILAQLRGHTEFCRRSLTIRDKSGQVVPLELTPAQVKLAAAIRSQEERGQPVRVVCLKARQVHMSVGACSQIFRRVAFLPGQQAMVFGDLYKSATNLWGYFNQFECSYQPFCGMAKLPLTRRVQDRRLEWQGGSWVEVASADSVTTGRSYSIRHLQLDEYAFYRDAATLMTGVMQSVPDDKDTTIIVLSTANGVGGPFYDLWQRANDPNNQSGWTPVFFGWCDHPEYTRPLAIDPVRFQASLDREEQDHLRQFHQCSLEQLNWRRWCIENKCESNANRFDQEYPCCPERAFLTSGRPRFDAAALSKQPLIREPLAGELDRIRVGTREQIQFLANDSGAGALRVWKRPVDGHRYTIGADTALGRDVGDELGNSDPDYSVAEVLDAATGEQVACLRARMEPAPFGEYLASLGEWYKWAYLVPEINFGSGIALIEELLRRQYPIGMIYQRRRRPDDRRTPGLQELGWETTVVTKPQLISTLDRAIREQSITIRDPVTLQECRTFVYLPTGKMGGQVGCHDDCVIALALAVVGIGTMPRETAQPGGPAKIVRYGGGNIERGGQYSGQRW